MSSPLVFGILGLGLGFVLGFAIANILATNKRKPDPYQAVAYPEPKSRSFVEYGRGDGKVTFTNLVSAFYSGASEIILDGWSIEREERYLELARQMGLQNMQPDDPALFEAHKEVMRRLDEEEGTDALQQRK